MDCINHKNGKIEMAISPKTRTIWLINEHSYPRKRPLSVQVFMAFVTDKKKGYLGCKWPNGCLVSLSKVLLGQSGSASGLLVVLWLNQTLLQLLMRGIWKALWNGWRRNKRRYTCVCVYIKYIYTYLLIFVHIYIYMYMICVPPTWDRCTNDNCGGVLWVILSISM